MAVILSLLCTIMYGVFTGIYLHEGDTALAAIYLACTCIWAGTTRRHRRP